MKNWTLNLVKNANNFDLIGYYKLMRFLGRSYISLVSADDINRDSVISTIAGQCNEFSKVLSIRYLFDNVTVTDTTDFENGVFDCLIALLKSSEQLATISKVIRQDIDDVELLKDYTTDSVLVRPSRTELDKCLIIRLSKEIVFINSLLKFYILAVRYKFDKESLLKYIPLLRDNYVPQALEKYLKEKIGYNFRFSDDCNGINVGSSLNMLFIDRFNNPKNPILIAPIYGGTRGIMFNLFNQQQEKDEYAELAEIIFGIKFEEHSPEKQLEFLVNRTFKYTMVSDIEIIISKLQKIGLGVNDILVDITCNRGYEQWVQYLMNRFYIDIYERTDIGMEAMRYYESGPIYTDSYLYLMTEMPFGRTEEILSGFLRSQFIDYFYICRNYLEKVENIVVTEKSFSMDNLYNLEIWTEKITLADTLNYRDIALWVVSTYYEFVRNIKEIPRDRLKQMLVISNMFNLNTIWYLNLVKHLLNVTEVKLKSFEISGKYILELTEASGDKYEYESVAIGTFLPKMSGVIIRNKKFKDEKEVDIFRRLIRFPVVSNLDIEVVRKNILLTEQANIVLVNPDTLDVYFYNKNTDVFDTRYKVHEEDCILVSHVGDEYTLNITRKYKFKLEPKKRLYILERCEENISLSTSTLNFKSHIFSQEEDEYW